MYLILWFGNVVVQKFQNQGTTEAAAFNLEMREAHGQEETLNIADADKARILHSFGESITLAAVWRDTDVARAIFTEAFAADIFITGFPVIAVEPSAFVAEKFIFIFLRLR